MIHSLGLSLVFAGLLLLGIALMTCSDEILAFLFPKKFAPAPLIQHKQRRK